LDWKKNRLGLAAGVLVVATGAAVFAARSRESSPASTDRPPSLPEFDAAEADHLVLTRPDKGEIAFEKQGDSWRMVAPVASDADQDAVTDAVEKLAELSPASLVAENPSLHERLGVTDKEGVHALVKHGDAVLADLWIGPYKSVGTLVRAEGEDAVVAVEGSIRYPFVKETHLYRDRVVTDLDAERVMSLVAVNGDQTYSLVKPSAEADWELAEGQAAVEDFDPARVKSLVSTLSRLRAAGFDAPDASEEARGLTAPKARVTLTLRPAAEGGEPEVVEIALGALDADSNQYSVRVSGSEVPFRLSKPSAEKLQVDAAALKKLPPPPPPAAGQPTGMPADGHGQLPPEVMRQLQQQMQQGGGHP